jgi:hypothetical protein
MERGQTILLATRSHCPLGVLAFCQKVFCALQLQKMRGYMFAVLPSIQRHETFPAIVLKGVRLARTRLGF